MYELLGKEFLESILKDNYIDNDKIMASLKNF